MAGPKTFASIVSTGGQVSDSNPLAIKQYGLPSYRAVYDSIALANGKYLAVLFSTSTAYHVDVHRVFVVHNNLTAATGVAAELSLLRISAYTTGTAITPLAYDPGALAIPAEVVGDHNSSSVSDVSDSTYASMICTGEEITIAEDDQLNASGINGKLLFSSGSQMGPIRLRGATAAHRGLAVKCLTNTTEGNVSIYIDFNLLAV